MDENWDAEQLRLNASFLQSFGWALFQQSLGVPYYAFRGENWSAICFEHVTPAGKYWLVPYGPTVSNEEALKMAVKELKAAAKSHAVHWLRIEPLKPIADIKALDQDIKAAPQHINPKFSIVSLLDDEESMRSRLTPNKRNLINRGTSRGLQFRATRDPKDMKLFIDMLRVTEERTKSRSHPDDYYQKQAEVLMPRGMMELNLAYGPENQVLAATVLNNFGGVISRVYASSYPEARKFEAGVGLDWFTMLRAKDQGMKEFDFYGAAPINAPEDHPWAGFTKYKSEFGGNHEERAGTWDLPLSKARYKLYLATRLAKKKLRR